MRLFIYGRLEATFSIKILKNGYDKKNSEKLIFYLFSNLIVETSGDTL